VCSVEEGRLSPAKITSMWDHNAHGGGVAWREENDNGEIVVKWSKGMMHLEEMLQIIPQLPLPYVAHFRIPTCGGSIKQLTHPFPIETNSTMDLEGETKEGVLFHNGSLVGWRHELKVAACTGGWKLPKGHYSDSRAMAIMAAHMGDGILELLEEKICVLRPERLDVFGSGWTVDERILVSNLGWKPREVTSQNRPFLGTGSGSPDRSLGAPGATQAGGAGGGGGAYHTTAPASMAGANVGGGPTVEVPFDHVPPTRKLLRRLRTKQEKHSFKQGITSPIGIYPS
jgi:hypothetical protein